MVVVLETEGDQDKTHLYFRVQQYNIQLVLFLGSLKLFTDDDREYKTLTQRVSQQVFHINGNISSIERLVGYLGGSRDTPDTRTKLYVIVFSDSPMELILSFPQPWSNRIDSRTYQRLDQRLEESSTIPNCGPKKSGMCRIVWSSCISLTCPL